MGNWSWLLGCESRAMAEGYHLDAIFKCIGPELEAKNYVPVFWLAPFGPDDCIVVKHTPDRPFTSLYVDAEVGIARVRQRREPLLALVGEVYRPLYDAWTEYLRANYPRGLLLRLESFFDGPDSFDATDARLRSTLHGLTRSDVLIPQEIQFSTFGVSAGDLQVGREEDPVNAAERHRRVLAGSSSTGTSWPPPPSPQELARLDPTGRAERERTLVV